MCIVHLFIRAHLYILLEIPRAAVLIYSCRNRVFDLCLRTTLARAFSRTIPAHHFPVLFPVLFPVPSEHTRSCALNNVRTGAKDEIVMKLNSRQLKLLIVGVYDNSYSVIDVLGEKAVVRCVQPIRVV